MAWSVQGETDILYVSANMEGRREKHKLTIGGWLCYEMPKMRNRDDCAKTKGKKADILFVPKLSLQPHIKDITDRLF